MKKAILLVASIAIAVAMKAQPDVTSAYNANKAGEYDKAAEYIEKALNDPKATSKEKTWRYRGNIYLNIASSPDFAAKFPNAVELSKQSFFKALEVDTDKEYFEENRQALGQLQGIILEGAEKQYTSNDFCSAAKNFKLSNEISTKFGIVDSIATFNSAYCNDRCGNVDEAIAGYQASAQMGYNVPAVYMYISELYLKAGKKDEAKKVLTDARAKYPKDAELLRSEVNMLLNEEKYEDALNLLVALTAADPNNETIWFVLGATYEKLNRVSDQEMAYKRATELNPKYYDALFNLGATYYNQGVEMLKDCDKIPPRETAKYEDCVAKSKVIFAKSIDQFERAYNEKPEDKEIISALKEAYVRVENKEGENRMKAALEKK